MCVWFLCGLCVSCVCEWCMGVFSVCGVYVSLCGVSLCVLSSVVFVRVVFAWFLVCVVCVLGILCVLWCLWCVCV